MVQSGAFTSETQSLLAHRVSVRKYRDQEVSAEMVEAILDAAFRAPTSSNIQAYSVVVVRDTSRLQALSTTTGNQKHVQNAPVFLAFCADITRIESALARHGKSVKNNNLELGLVATIDAALVGMSTSLVAQSFGLAGVMIGAVRNNPLEVARILALPDQVYCVFGMCLGWPDESPRQKPRMAPSAMVHYEQYGHSATADEAAQQVADYDRHLHAHYTAVNKPTTAASWTDEMAKKFSPQPRANLRLALKELGFDFL